MAVCPHDGITLVRLPDEAVSDVTAPYLCNGCRRAWWGSELTAAARRLYDPVTAGWSSRDSLVAGIMDEQAQHRRREAERRGPGR